MQVDGVRFSPYNGLGNTVRLGGERMPSESELIERAKTGDRNAMDEIVADCWQPLYRFISYKTGRPDEAQDIVQETFYRAFRSLSSYQKTEARFSTWLGRIAANLITDSWRKNGRSPVMNDIGGFSNQLMGGENPLEELVSRENRETIAMLLNELQDEQRRVIELRIIAGLPVKEVAIALGKSEASIKMLQQRALKNLRIMLLDRGVLEPK